MTSTKPIEGPLRTAILAGLFVVVAAVIAMIWGGQQLIGVSGATDLAADAQGHVWLALNGKLERLSAEGAIEKTFDLEELGIGTPNAIVPLPDGNVWVGSLDHERLVLLSPDGKKLAEAVPPSSVGPIYGTFHAAYEPTSDRLVVADTQNHRLLAFTGAGEFVAASGSALDLRFPNAIIADGHGGLLVVDTNHHKLKALTPDLSQTSQALPEMHAVEVNGRSRHFTWPVWVSVAPDGRSFVSWHGSDLGNGAVLAYAADSSFAHSLALGPSAEPQGLLARGDDVLVALKSDQQFTLVHFNRYGVALGAFGSAELQSQLTAASTRATFLSRMQQGGRVVVVLGALGLLLLALRIRNRQEQSASEAVVKLKEPAPKGRMLAIVGAVVGLFILLMIVQFGWLAMSVAVGSVAKQTHSPILMGVARWGMPILLGLVVFGIITFWRSTKLFLTLQMYRAKRRMQAWAPYLPAMLEAGENVEDYGLASSVWRVKLLLTTNHRLLLLGAAGDTRKPLWQAPWTAIRCAHAAHTASWLRVISPTARMVAVECRGLQPSLQVYAINHWHVEQLESMTAAAKARFIAHPPAPLPSGTAPRSQAAASPLCSPRRSALLSLLLPGLGHLEQGRLRQGISLIFGALGVLGIAAVSWITALGHFADQPWFLPGILVIVYAAVCIFSAWDAVRYARGPA